MTEEEYERKILNLNDNSSSLKLILKSLKSIFEKENIYTFIFSFLIGFGYSCFLAFSENTVIIYKELCSELLNIIIAIFGVSFSAFALLQAYINTNICKSMIPLKFEDTKKDFDEDTMFPIQKANKSFVVVLMISLINIIVLFLLRIFLIYIPNDFLIFNNLLVSNYSCLLLSSILFSLIVYNIISIKSIIRDLYVLFNLGTYAGIQEEELKRRNGQQEQNS